MQWFNANLDNFDVSDSGLENVQLFVETTSPLLGSNAGHLPHDLRVIVNRFVTGTLKKEVVPTNKKRGRGDQSTPASDQVVECVQSEGEEFSSPAKKGKKIISKKTNPPAQPMDLEVHAASETTAAPVKLSSTFETQTHQQDESDAALPYTCLLYTSDAADE